MSRGIVSSNIHDKVLGSDHLPVETCYEYLLGEGVGHRGVKGKLKFCSNNLKGIGRNQDITKFFKVKDTVKSQFVKDEDHIKAETEVKQDMDITVVCSQSQKEGVQPQISKVQAVYTRDNNNSSEYWKKVLNGEKAPVCWHHKECVKRKVTNENNPRLGKQFFCCANPKGLNNAWANLNDPEDNNQCN